MLKLLKNIHFLQLGESAQWYKWGPAHLDLRLCAVCWIIWKKHGGLKRPHELGFFIFT